MPDLTDPPTTSTYTAGEFVEDICNLLVAKEQVVSISNGTLDEITAVAQRLLDLLVHRLPPEDRPPELIRPEL